jgi:hypothetical protein
MKLSDAVQFTPPKILAYGRPGTGKTATVTSLGALCEVIDIGKGLGTALTMKDEFSAQRQLVDVTPCYPTGATGLDAFSKAKGRIFQIAQMCANKTYTRKVLILDDLTSLGDQAMRAVRGPNALVSNKQPTLQEWGLAINDVEICLQVLVQLPIPVIVVAHTMTEEINQAAALRASCIGNKLGDKLPAYFDEIWYFKLIPAAGGSHWVIQTQPDAAVMARTRRQLQDSFIQKQGLLKAFELMGYKLT